jgi:ketosteroid isomerase-like protein
LRAPIKILLMVLAVLMMAGCSGQWAPNNGGGGGGQGRNKPHATEDEVRQQFEKLMWGFANRDINAINGMMSSNATFINPQAGAGVFTWTDARPMLEQAFARGPYQLSNDSAYRIGVERDLGWIATVYHVRAPGPNGLLQSDGGVSVLFQKTVDGYKVLMFHISRFPPPVASATKPESGAKPSGSKK